MKSLVHNTLFRGLVTGFAAGCLVVSMGVGAAPAVGGLDSGLRSADLVPLTDAEMGAIQGEWVHFPIVAGVFFGGATGAVGNAIGQYQSSGSVDFTGVALAGLGGAALGAVNVAAAVTGSPTLIVTAGGLDLAATAAAAFAAPEVSHYSQSGGYTDITIDGADYTIPPLQPVGGLFDLSMAQPNVVTVNVSPTAIAPDASGALGAGEEQYLYF